MSKVSAFFEFFLIMINKFIYSAIYFLLLFSDSFLLDISDTKDKKASK